VSDSGEAEARALDPDSEGRAARPQ
jgi:hypothetical protein